MSDLLIERIDAILPQTQCGQCGFSGCRPYATAIVAGLADINQCPPGGTRGIQELAELLGVKPKPLNTAYGITKPKAVALIDENICIGCTFCVQSCPVDAIVGAAKQMHTVISAECTGCELCIASCPVNCISMIPVKERTSHIMHTTTNENKKHAAALARRRHQFRLKRQAREKQAHKERLAEKISTIKSIHTTSTHTDRKKAIIQAAIKRAIAARAQAVDKKKQAPHEPS